MEEENKKHTLKKHVLPVLLAVLVVFVSVVGFAVPASAVSYGQDFYTSEVFHDEPFGDDLSAFQVFKIDGSLPVGFYDFDFARYIYRDGSFDFRFFDGILVEEVNGIKSFTFTWGTDRYVADIEISKYDSVICSSPSSLDLIDEYGDYVYYTSYIFNPRFSVIGMAYDFLAGGNFYFVNDSREFGLMFADKSGTSLSAADSLEVNYSLLLYSAEYGGWLNEDCIFVSGLFSPLNYDSMRALDVYHINSYHPSFFARIGAGFTAIISWFGTFFGSLIGGNLSMAFVLLSVGFGIALLAFSWRWIRRFLWGL